MPTTTRLVAAILTAALGWGAGFLSIPYMPEGQQLGLFLPISAGFGALIGWFWTGKKIELGLGKPLGLGFIGSVLLVFWVLMAFSLTEMLRRSSHVRYDGPVEALQDMITVAIEYFRDLVLQPDVLGVLVVGGLLIGAICGWVSRRFR